MIKISIITINYNNKEGLGKTISSVVKQHSKAYEYIVIDGGSDDGSAELLKSHSSEITFSISEKDSGIYNAMNKGIAKATGDYLLFLNSGDYLKDEEVIQRLDLPKFTSDIVYGDILWESVAGNELQTFPDRLSFDYFYRLQFLPHQSTFIKRSLFTTIGLYDEDQKIISDWIFFVKAIFRHNCTYQHVHQVIAISSRDGISCDPKNIDDILNEKRHQLRVNFPNFISDYAELKSSREMLSSAQKLLGFRLHRKLNKILGVKGA